MEVVARPVPFLTTAQMVEVDRIMVDDLHVSMVQMMENAGRALARLASALYLPKTSPHHSICVLVGPGGNGGGALVAARLLRAWGWPVHVLLSVPPAGVAGVTLQQLEAVRELGIPVGFGELPECSPKTACILDGLIGYGLTGPPRAVAADLIGWANHQPAPTLALDVPSGLDATTGETPGAIVRAQATVTLALPKTGLCAATATPFVGDLYLADIGVPHWIYTEIDAFQEVGALFTRSDVIRVAAQAYPPSSRRR